MADSIIQQLVHRKMFRITAGYLAVAWVLWQVVDTTCPTFECSLSFQKSIFWFLIAGLPITLAVAWVNWRTAIVVGVAFIAGAGVAVFVMGVVETPPQAEVPAVAVAQPEEVVRPSPEPTPPEEKSIAVLPFTDMSAAGDQGYFGDGVAEEILNALVKLPELRVAARTSAFSLRGQSIDVVGEKLNVNHVLEGSVRKEGDRLRITAQLLKVDDGFHLWSETYDRKLTSIFAVQDEIAQSVVAKLEVALGLSDEEPLVRSGTSDTEAYNWYLRGRHYIEQQSPEGFQNAVAAFTEAVSIDPNFAGGHGGLAYALAYLSIYEGADITASGVAEQIRTSSSRALELDVNQPEALMAQAYELKVTQYDFQTAEKLLKRALSAAPNKTLVVDFYSFFLLLPERRFADALVLLQGVERTDPLSALAKEGIGAMLMWQGHYKEATTKLEETLALNPVDAFAIIYLPVIQARLARFDEADVSLSRLDDFMGDHEWVHSSRALVQIAKGECSTTIKTFG